MSKKKTVYFDVTTRVKIISDKNYPLDELEKIAYRAVFCGGGFGAGATGSYDTTEAGKKIELVK